MYIIIGGDGKEYGPVSGAELRQWVSEGRLNAQSLAKAESDAEFRALSTFPELADAFTPTAPASAVPPPFAPLNFSERDYELDIGVCFSNGWTLVKNNFWPSVGVTFLVTIVMGVINQIFELFSHSSVNAMVKEHQISVGGIAIIFSTSIIGGMIYTLLMAGLFRYFLNLIRGENATVGDAFSGFGPFSGQLILFGLVQAILVLIGYALCIVPGVYLQIAWLFGIPLIIDRRMKFWDAMELSRKMVTKHWLIVFAFFIVYTLLVLAGLIACCVGIFVTMAIGVASLMYAYETIFGDSQTG